MYRAIATINRLWSHQSYMLLPLHLCSSGPAHSRAEANAVVLHACCSSDHALLLQGSAAPVASWTAARVASDMALSKDLILKLDAEKGIEQNAFAPQLQQAPAETGATRGAAVDTHLATLIPASQMVPSLLFSRGLRPKPCITHLQSHQRLTLSSPPVRSSAEC